MCKHIPIFDIFYMKELMNIAQEIISDEAIVLDENSIKEDALEGCYFLAISFFCYILDNYEEALNYFQIIVEDNYPGVNVYLVSVNTKLPENSICIKVRGSVEELNKDTKERSLKYLKEFRKDINLQFIYTYMITKINKSLKDKDFVVKEI